MTTYEIISVCASILAVIIAGTSLFGSFRNSKRQLNLEQKTADLAEEQLRLIGEQKLQNTTPKLDAEIIKAGASNRLVISNIGKVEVREVSFSCVGMPVPSDEYRRKVPIPSLRPGKSVEFIAYKDLSSIDDKYKLDIRWNNIDGSNGKDEILVFW